MSSLDIETSRLADPDEAYRQIIEAHRGLSEEDSAALDARLVLILANHIGDLDVLRAALRLARAGIDTMMPEKTGKATA